MRHEIPPTKIRKNAKVISEKIPRPPNSFMIYRKEHLKNFSLKTAAALSVAIGEQWRNEPLSVRIQYSRLAEEARQKHLEEHPLYKFKPKKRRPSNPKLTSKENEPTLPADEQKSGDRPVEPKSLCPQPQQ
ncbi:hypothetical protein BGX26_002761 [Mortierella sp. AD094]|nr:hypothetical protein BGX26_002761 [Mortierella sp. AD094]